VRSCDEVGEPAEDPGALVCAIAANQDRQAFALLFKRFAPRVKAYLMRSGMGASAAEEVAQEAMLSVWRKAAYFDPARGGVSTWIFTIARNLRIDRLRKERLPDTFDVEPSEEADPPPSAEATVLAVERDARVRQALGALPEEQAVVVRLSFLSDKPHGEIARELGIPLGTVKSRVRLAMKRLRDMLDAP
jgi:RNA polymerase sigma-70 factor (ECF subfamily)